MPNRPVARFSREEAASAGLGSKPVVGNLSDLRPADALGWIQAYAAWRAGELCSCLGSRFGPPRDDSRDPQLPPQTVRRDLAVRGDEGNIRGRKAPGISFLKWGSKARLGWGLRR